MTLEEAFKSEKTKSLREMYGFLPEDTFEGTFKVDDPEVTSGVFFATNEIEALRGGRMVAVAGGDCVILFEGEFKNIFYGSQTDKVRNSVLSGVDIEAVSEEEVFLELFLCFSDGAMNEITEEELSKKFSGDNP